MLRWGACRKEHKACECSACAGQHHGCAILLASGVAQAIINGEPDRGPNAHSYVGALVSVPPSGEFKGQRIPLCSGTLISARVFLSAGHCTQVLIKEGLPTYVSFDPTYKPGASQVISATPYTHPKFCFPTSEDKGKCSIPPKRPEIVGALPRDVRYDVGVAVLEEPVKMASYGALPDTGLVDTLEEANASPPWATARPDSISVANRPRGQSIRTTATGAWSGSSLPTAPSATSYSRPRASA